MWTMLISMAALASVPDLTGTWILDESDETLRARHESAIQSAVDQLPWALRPFARGPLEKIIRSCRELKLRFDSEALHLRCDDLPPFELAPPRPRSTIHGERGEPIEVRWSTTPASATLAFQGEEGGQTTTYLLQDDALQLTTTLQGPRLPEPVSWEARYRRRP